MHKAVKLFNIHQLSNELKIYNDKAINVIKDCYLFSASCYIKINQFDSAIQLMDELLEAELQNVKALYLRGKAYYQRGDQELAFKDFSTAIKVEPQN